MKQKRNFLVALALTLAAVLVILGVFQMISVYGHYRSDMLSYESRHLNSIVSATTRGLEVKLLSYEDLLAGYTERYEFKAAEASYQTTGDVSVMQMLMARPDVGDRNGSFVVAVYDTDGAFLAASDSDYPARNGNDEYLKEGLSIRETDGKFWFVFTNTTDKGYTYELGAAVKAVFSYHANSAKVGQNGYLILLDGEGRFLCYSGRRHIGICDTETLASENEGIELSALNELASVRSADADEYRIFDYPWQLGDDSSLYGKSTLVVTSPLNMGSGTLVLCAALSFREFSSILTDTLRDVSTVILYEVVGMIVLLGVAVWLLTLNRRDSLELAVVKEKADMMEEINRQQQSLEHTERLQQLGIMTSGIVHEFNNMLTPIMSQSLLLLEELADREDSPEFENALDIFEASEKAREVLRRMSSMSKKDMDMNFVSMDMNTMLRKTANLAAMAKDPHIQIELKLPDEPIFVSGNDKLLSQAFLNLFINGCQAMGTEGTLTVAAEPESRAGRNYVRVEVCDTGTGIPEDRIGMIYDPFFTTKGEKGTGLGLAICQKIIETHKGTITASNRPKGGAEFAVRLPMADGE